MPALIHCPPPVFFDEQWNFQFHVENVLKWRRHKGQYHYPVKWRGYPESENLWEFEVALRQDCPYAVGVFERHAEGQLSAQRASHQ